MHSIFKSVTPLEAMAPFRSNGFGFGFGSGYLGPAGCFDIFAYTRPRLQMRKRSIKPNPKPQPWFRKGPMLDTDCASLIRIQNSGTMVLTTLRLLFPPKICICLLQLSNFFIFGCFLKLCEQYNFVFLESNAVFMSYMYISIMAMKTIPFCWKSEMWT